MKLLYTTWPDPGTAREAAIALVEEGLAACANILPGMTSVYRWEGQVESAGETVMLVKVADAQAAATTARILALHPNETPAIAAIGVDAAASAPDFLAWVERSGHQA
jgi:periplasmic divalent cation tolerance protein